MTCLLLLAACSLTGIAAPAEAGADRTGELSLVPAEELGGDGTLRVRGESAWRRQVAIEERLEGAWQKRAVTRPNRGGRFRARLRPRASGRTLLRARSGARTSSPERAPGRAKPPKPEPATEPPVPPASPPAFAVGFNNQAVTDKQLSAADSAALLGEVGAQVDRVQINWAQLEPERGQFRFERYDAIYAADLANGVRPLFNFAYAPSWANGGVCPDVSGCYAPPTPDHYDDAARAVAKIATRYPEAIGIELWNEPNGAYFWRPAPDPIAYTALLKACAEAIDAANPAMPLAGPSTASGPGSVTTGKISSADFLGAMYLAGAAPALDVISVHSYPRETADTVTSAATELDRVRLARDWYGDPAAPIWITETGVTTTGPWAVSEAEQARRLTDLDRLLRETPDVEMTIFHTLVEPAHDPSSPWPGYGIVTADLRRKPAFCSLAAAWGGTAAC